MLKAREEASDAQRRITDADSRIARLERTLEDKESEIDRLGQLVGAHEMTIRTHENRASQYSVDIAHRDNQISDLKALRDQQSQVGHEAEQQASDRIIQLEEEVREQERIVRSYQETTNENTNTIVKLGDEISKLKQDLSNLEGANEELKKENVSKTSYALTYMNQLRDLRNTHDDLRIKLRFTENERDRARVDDNHSQGQYNELFIRNRNLQRKYDDEVRQHTKNNTELNKQVQRLEADMQSQKQRLESQVQQLEVELQNQKQQTSTSQSTVQKLTIDRDEYWRSYQQAASELAADRQKLEYITKESETLRSVNQQQSLDIVHFEQRLAAAEQDIAKMKTEADSALSNLTGILRQERLVTARYFAAESRAQPVQDETWLRFAEVQNQSAMIERNEQTNGPSWTVSQVWLSTEEPPAISIPETLDMSTLIARLYGDMTTRSRSNQSLHLLGALTERLAAEPRARLASIRHLVQVAVETQPKENGERGTPLEDAFVLALWRLAKLLRARWGLDVEESVRQLEILSSSPLCQISEMMRDYNDSDLLRTYLAEPYIWPDEKIGVKQLGSGWLLFIFFPTRRLQLVHSSRLELTSLDHGVVHAPEGLDSIWLSLLRPRQTLHWLLCMG
ncbi:hypothetical protein F4818DRAFT_455584 [Hypoxylon cercidicola]|nr:hypothetical protein F4818DRAFT_455584 [Hypoxylon cercidicola]